MSAGRPACLVFLPDDHSVIFLGGAAGEEDAQRLLQRLGLPPASTLHARRLGSLLILSQRVPAGETPGEDRVGAGQADKPAPAGQRRVAVRRLNPEQRMVYDLLRLGLTDRQIGARLRRRRRWVCYRVSEIKQAFGVVSRAELIKMSSC